MEINSRIDLRCFQLMHMWLWVGLIPNVNESWGSVITPKQSSWIFMWEESANALAWPAALIFLYRSFMVAQVFKVSFLLVWSDFRTSDKRVNGQNTTADKPSIFSSCERY